MGKWWSARVASAVAGLWLGNSGRKRAGGRSVNPAAASYIVECGSATDVGRVRSSNQDATAFIAPSDPAQRRRRGVLAVVADGMGGHNAGEVASGLAIETICRCYFAAPGDDPRHALEMALREANDVVFRAAQADATLEGMGTTVTALALVGGNGWFAHVGDSRLYRCSAGQCVQLTQDQTLVAELVKNNLLSAEQARHHPARNVLVSSLGTQASLRVVAERCAPPLPGDCFVLCSDGLWESVEPGDIAASVASDDVEGACRELVALALERDGHDNVSVVVLALRPVESTPDAPASPLDAVAGE
jgi:serine/threonine protein phosphatase PrpC